MFPGQPPHARDKPAREMYYFHTSIRLRELPQFPGEYEYVSYSIRQLVAELIKFTHDPAH